MKQSVEAMTVRCSYLSDVGFDSFRTAAKDFQVWFFYSDCLALGHFRRILWFLVNLEIIKTES